MDQPEEARAALERIRDIARTTGELRLMHTWCAASYLHEGDTEGALSEIQNRLDIAREIDDRPAMSGDLGLMGNILLNAGRIDLASSRFEESVETIQNSDATEDIKATVRRNHTFDLARIALRRGDLDAAADLAATYRDAVAVNNVRGELQQSRQLDGMVSLAKGEPKAALFDLANANQQNPQVLFLNARAFMAIGDREAARAACRQVVDFNQLSFNLAYVRESARKLLKSL
jgi:tetratricopeptide (TPR) repeat protein